MTAPQVITFGCRLNTYESEAISQMANDAALENTIIFNTCAVTAEATRQARQAIRKARRENPEARVLVTGCAAQIDPQTFANMKEVDAVFGNIEKGKPATYQLLAKDSLPRVKVNDIMSVRETAGHMVRGFKTHSRAFVEIQNGCDHRCTFCIIPYGRGNSRSVPIGGVIEQIKKLVDAGYKEVVLTGVDLTSYGPDLPGTPSLGSLVQKILKLVPDLPRLRLSSIDSIEADEALIDVITGEKRLMPHLHLSLQAGSNMILKRMKRRHLREDAIHFCEDIRKKRPEIVFGADIITGFPTETEKMFEESLALVDECGLSFLHVFPYSARKGTPAARMPQVPQNIRKERAARLRQKGEEAVKTLFENRHGKSAKVLAERTENGHTLGHSEDFIPVSMQGNFKAGTIIKATLNNTDMTVMEGISDHG